MDRRTRLYELPSNVVEVWGYRDVGDEDDPNPGLYLEWQGSEPAATGRGRTDESA